VLGCGNIFVQGAHHGKIHEDWTNEEQAEKPATSTDSTTAHIAENSKRNNAREMEWAK
jgi:hypothetical protein